MPTVSTVESWAELNAWLKQRIDHAREFLDEGETAQAGGHDAYIKHSARLLAYMEVRHLIAEQVGRERAGKAIEAAYRAAGFEDMDPIEQRMMDGDR